MTRPLPLKLDDEQAERVRRSHEKAITELQSLPVVSQVTIANVQLANATATTIAHKLGRAPSLVTVSVPRGAVSAGYIVETRSGVDSTHSLILTANGYGATITVDVVVQ